MPAPPNFRLPFRPYSLPPAYDQKLLQLQENENWLTLSILIKTLQDNCGISPRLPADWALLSGEADTLLAGNLNRFYVEASENILDAAAINLVNIAGAIRVRNANATNNTKPCDGFCSTVGGIGIGTVGEVQLHGGAAEVGGLVVGARYFLGTANGTITTVRPVAAGNIEQYLGLAVTDSVLAYNLGYWIQH